MCLIIKQFLTQKYISITNLGEPQNFLGMNIVRNRENRSLHITQEKYINNIIKRFGFDDLHPQNTHMITRQVANKERKEREDETEIDEFCEIFRIVRRLVVFYI